MAYTKANRWVLLSVVTAICLFLDMYSKARVVHGMTPGDVVPLAGSWLQLMFVYNKGALFGLNPAALIPGFPVNAFFYLFSGIAIVLLLLYYVNIPSRSIAMFWGISLILPGALGNLFDRVFHPQLGVVDFIKVDFGFWPCNPWPIFNFADIYITVGVLLILFTIITNDISIHMKKRSS